jgi:hypothetical protein
LFQSNVVLPFPAGALDSKSDLLPPQPCIITIVGKGPSPLGGSVTSTSSGTPSNVGTRCCRVSVGQKRTPFCALQACPNGAGSAAASAGAASTPHAIANPLADMRVKRRPLTPTS